MMGTKFSVFLMDVSDSRKLSKTNRARIRTTLTTLEQTIHDWTQDILVCKTDLRMGDELLVISEHYSTAYLLAYHIYTVWRGVSHSPYFGIAVGETDETWEEIGDIDLWTHPVIAQAREASETLKARRLHRPEMYIYHPISQVSDELNYLLEVQHTLMSQQSQQQRWASLLYTYLQSQQDVAEMLDISVPAVSGLISRGNHDIIEKTHALIRKKLDELESLRIDDGFSRKQSTNLEEQLSCNIRANRAVKIQSVEELILDSLMSLL